MNDADPLRFFQSLKISNIKKSNKYFFACFSIEKFRFIIEFP